MYVHDVVIYFILLTFEQYLWV